MENHLVQTGWGSAPAPDLFPYFFLVTGDNISQYKDTCEVLLEYPKIGGGGIKDFIKNSIRNILRNNIDVNSWRLISGFPVDGVKCIETLQSHCANMTFSEKSKYDRIFQKLTHKGGESVMNYIKIFQHLQALWISVENTCSQDQLMHIFLYDFHQSRKYSAQIASH